MAHMVLYMPDMIIASLLYDTVYTSCYSHMAWISMAYSMYCI